METRTRKPFEGVANIIRFNWHFYVVSAIISVALLAAAQHTSGYIKIFMLILFFLLLTSTFLSLAVSFYVYDLSCLYTLDWLPSLHSKDSLTLININAGFDETSYLLANKYPDARFMILDFYNAKQHTEISIARARKRYPLYPGTIVVSTSSLPLTNESADAVFAIFSAHEIRNRQERVAFFTEIKNKLKEDGIIIVAEHLRDTFNFIAYNIGFFHFYSAREWKKTFTEAGLRIMKEATVTPFIHVFILQKYGNAL